MRVLTAWDKLLKWVFDQLKNGILDLSRFLQVCFRYLWFWFLRKDVVVKGYSITHFPLDKAINFLYIEQRYAVKVIIQNNTYPGNMMYFPYVNEGNKGLLFTVIGYNSSEDYFIDTRAVRVAVDVKPIKILESFTSLKNEIKLSDTIPSISDLGVKSREVVFNKSSSVFGPKCVRKTTNYKPFQLKTNLEFSYEKQEEA